MRRLLAGLILLAAVAAAPRADAAVVVPVDGLASATNGAVLGPDGNMWVSEQFNGSVVRLSPAGAVLDRYAVGGDPGALTTGPGGRVWVAVPGTTQLVWFDATASQPTAHPVTPVAGCAPVGLVGDADRLYASFPGCGGGTIRSIDAAGTAGPAVAVGGQVFDMAIGSGKLFAPVFDGDEVLRLSLAATPAIESTVDVSGGSGPDGVVVTGTDVWVTEFNTSRLARLPTAQQNGTATELVPTGVTLSNPFGIVASPNGGVVVASKGNGLLASTTDGSAATALTLGGEPFRVALGPDSELWVTDQQLRRVTRVIDRAPRSGALTGAPTGSSTATATVPVDTGGNDTTVTIATEGGQALGSQAVASAAGAQTATIAVTGLPAGTATRVRATVTNSRGSTAGELATVTTPAVPAPVVPATPKRVVKAKLSVKAKATKRRTTLRRVVVTRLAGNETIRIRCSGKRRACPFTSRSVKVRRAGKRDLSRLFGPKRPLRPGAKLTVRITAPGATGRVVTVAVRKGRKPKLRTRTLAG